ncbi:hypothetical protein MKW98_003134 [Papaver atlanticum]|uniref:Uncharacterized protein n=1 Tax=Papaver atlanticum TaxID=357466 RepID=A0AAD4TES2_9MAGN|nr:hypothetical protein MKW98_003134 [Papaver atlanticum]
MLCGSLLFKLHPFAYQSNLMVYNGKIIENLLHQEKEGLKKLGNRIEGFKNCHKIRNLRLERAETQGFLRPKPELFGALNESSLMLVIICVEDYLQLLPNSNCSLRRDLSFWWSCSSENEVYSSSKRMNIKPSHGPIHFTAPGKIFWRTIHGYLFVSNLEDVIPVALKFLRLQPGQKYCLLGRLSSEVGWTLAGTIRLVIYIAC